jgi:hypothetical protein
MLASNYTSILAGVHWAMLDNQSCFHFLHAAFDHFADMPAIMQIYAL